jgi:5-dehydro-4-deoxyglucarate dehydratase
VTTLDGVLFFPVTPFDRAGELDLSALADHVSQRLAAGPGGVFVACGTGEFHALDLAEYAQVVSTAVRVTGGQVPVFAGAGGPVALARAQARSARDAGADGLLLLPPYLVQAPATGLVDYAASVAAASELPIIAYHRGNAQFDPAAAAALARIPSVVGLKDGVGDLELLGRIIVSVRAALAGSGKPFQFFNGMPTAEMSVPAYRGLGVELYSSAVFCFAPEISLAFYRAVTRGDDALRDRLLVDFFAPLVALRSTTPGYAVSLVKAGVRLRGLDAGGVRPPLIDPSPEHVEQLQRILTAGLAVVG